MPMSEKNLRDMMMPPGERRKPPPPTRAKRAGSSRARRPDNEWWPTTYEAWSLLAPLLTAGLTFLLAAATGVSGGFGGVPTFSPWVGAGLILLSIMVVNFILMTLTWAHRVCGAKGFFGAILAWVLIANLAL